MFDKDGNTRTKELEDMWQQIHSVYVEAERCHKDENAWIKVVCTMGWNSDATITHTIPRPTNY